MGGGHKRARGKVTKGAVGSRRKPCNMCGNYGSAPGHRTTEALHVAPMVVARAFTPPETAWEVGRPVAQATVPCSSSPDHGRYRCFRGARNSPLAESQFWPFNRLPWLGHAWLDFGKLNGQRAVPCPRGGRARAPGGWKYRRPFLAVFRRGWRFLTTARAREPAKKRPRSRPTAATTAPACAMTPQSPRVAVRGVARAGRTTLGLALERPIMWALGRCQDVRNPTPRREPVLAVQ